MSTALVGLKRASKPSIIWSIVLMLFGLLAIAVPTASSVGIVVVVGWLVLFDGIAQLVHAFQSKGVGHMGWKLLVALLYLSAGFYLLSRPLIAMTGLTLVLAIFLFAEGVVDVIAYFSTSKSDRSAWMLLDGIVTLVLGVMIWRRWPFASLWVIGPFST